MKSITLACSSCLILLTFQASGEPAKNEFPMVIEGLKCSVKAYKATEPIVFEPLVDKDSRPKSRLIVAIMLSYSDVSSYMSDEEISVFFEPKLGVDRVQKFRSTMKAAFNWTLPSTTTKPWKGVEYSISQAFEVESEKGKFLVYRLTQQGGQNNNNELTGSIKNSAGTWKIGGEKGEDDQKFQVSMVKLVPAEFAKLHQASSIAALPLEDLLNGIPPYSSVSPQ